MPQFPYVPHPEGTTREEFQTILRLRLQALAEATQLDGLGAPLPVTWRVGWKAHIRLLGRDRDGSLKVAVVVEGPRGETPYSRHYRLVKKEHLPWNLQKGVARE